ncbi:MAG: hypothetical protein WDZ51_03480 [Pirellulaceae bacterium]
MASSAPLRKLCLARCGFDPDDLSEIELKARLPDIIKAVNAELVATCGVVHRQVVEVQKAARLQLHYQTSYIPSEGLERDERLPDVSEISGMPGDPNAILDDIFPQ